MKVSDLVKNLKNFPKDLNVAIRIKDELFTIETKQGLLVNNDGLGFEYVQLIAEEKDITKMKTFGDYKERCNVPNDPIVHRCGICDDAFDTKKELDNHHIKMKEQKYIYHKPIRTAGGFCYLVDAQGFRVNDRGRRY